MTAPSPNLLLLDLRRPIAEYQQAVRHMADRLDIAPSSIIGWLCCYITHRNHAEEQLYVAIWDAVGTDPDVEEKDRDCFMEAADALGQEILNLFDEYGIYTPVDGALPYALSRVLGSTVIFKRVDGE